MANSCACDAKAKPELLTVGYNCALVPWRPGVECRGGKNCAKHENEELLRRIASMWNDIDKIGPSCIICGTGVCTACDKMGDFRFATKNPLALRYGADIYAILKAGSMYVLGNASFVDIPKLLEMVQKHLAVDEFVKSRLDGYVPEVDDTGALANEYPEDQDDCEKWLSALSAELTMGDMADYLCTMCTPALVEALGRYLFEFDVRHKLEGAGNTPFGIAPLRTLTMEYCDLLELAATERRFWSLNAKVSVRCGGCSGEFEIRREDALAIVRDGCAGCH